MQLENLSVSEAIRSMKVMGIHEYSLSRGVGVYEQIRFCHGQFSIKERFESDFHETNYLPMAWLIGDNWKLRVEVKNAK